MKKYIHSICVCAFVAILPLSAVAQDIEKSVFRYDKYGNVKSVDFSPSDREKGIKSADVFFREILKVKANNTFVRNQEIRLEKGDESFNQFYKGIKVENAGYTFHYDENGKIRYAHGNYVDISNLDTNPTISKEDASKAFAKYKGLSSDSITNYTAELVISVNSEQIVDVPILVYKVYIEANNACLTEYGYVDAKAGNVVYTESYIHHSAATGTFVTKYYGTKDATTNYSNGSYYLYDTTRGNGIEVKDLQNYSIYHPFYSSIAQSLSDGDNYWHYYDYTDSTFMAFDVFWALQKIYDRLYNIHCKNSLDNNGKKIMAYVKALVPSGDGNLTTDGACWHNNRKELYFGSGSGWKRPVSAIDVVAHEFGHGITYYQIGWSGSERFLQEGLSDIWAAIMDYRFGGSNSDVWKFGEHMIPNYICIRNLQHPGALSSFTYMADTYNSPEYNNYAANNSHYGMSGVFSHWFYLLVNGGNHNNSNGQHYNLNPVGMDVAENLIVKAVYGNYLRNTTTYMDVRHAFEAAARAMNVNGLVSAVCNAWYAVGVGDMDISLTGPHLTSSQSIYSVNGLPSGFNVVWSLTDSYYYQNCLQQGNPAPNQCKITRSNSQDMMDATLTATIKYNSDTIMTLTKTKLYAYAGFKGNFTSGGESGVISYPYLFYVCPTEYTIITSPNFLEATISYDNSATEPSFWEYNTQYGDMRFVMPANNNGTPIVINVTDSSGNYYQIYAWPQNGFYLNFFPDDNSITFTLNKGADTQRNLAPAQTWTMQIRNAATGELMVNRSMSSPSTKIYTVKWPKGVYVIIATIGREVLTEKIIVK